MSFKISTTKEGTLAIEAVVEKGLECTLNGLEVILNENVHFFIKNARSIDQAAEICSIQGLPVDFSHVDPDTGKNVRYTVNGERIETDPVVEEVVEEVVEVKETKAQEKARLKAEKEAADKEAEEAAAAAEATAKAEAEAAEAAKKAEEEAAKANTETEETEGK